VLRGHNSLTGLLALEGNILVSGNADSTIRVWDISTGTCLHILVGHQSSITTIKLHGWYILSCSDDGTVYLWDRRDGRRLGMPLNVATAFPPEARDA